jgi:predicted transcriptional regulator
VVAGSSPLSTPSDFRLNDELSRLATSGSYFSWGDCIRCEVEMRRVGRIMLSLRPEWAEAIYRREKHVEFRRQRVRVEPGDLVVIYETRPVGLVTGEFVVRGVHYGPPRDIKKLESDLQRARSVAMYLRGARVATALEIGRPRRYGRRQALAKYKVSKAPMSYVRLPDLSR